MVNHKRTSLSSKLFLFNTIITIMLPVKVLCQPNGASDNQELG